MEPTVLALTVLGGLLVLVVAFVTGRTVQVGRAERALEARASEADALAQQLEQRAEWFEREHVQKAQAELARRQRRLQERQAEHKGRVQKAKAKLEARRDALERRAALLNDREGLLEDAADILEALQAEAEKRRDEAESLRASIQAQAKTVGRRQQELAAREREIESLESELAAQKRRLDALTETTRLRLEAASGLSRQEAVRQLTEEMRREAKLEAAASIKNIEDEARLTAARQARQIVLGSIQRLAAQQTVENTVSVVTLASDDMKGRIIGREGRNIRAFEAATGIEVVVDDTPEAVILSGFDPVRREVARLAMNKLVADGRIHPARIEEVVEKTRGELEEEIVETGERVLVDLSLHGLAPELIRLVGRMRYRSSYGQNLLAHSVEVAKLSSLMAAELGLDARKARRAGLLHDIGKVIEGDLERPHALAGMEIAHQYKEHPEICNAIGAHHDEIEMTCLIAPVVQAADAASGARPGARREALENYVQRLKTLERLAESFDGVHQAYAIQAGRELRVIVNHERVSDAVAASLARDIVERIEREMQYPGQIKVTVIREVRNVAFAK